LDTAGSWDPFFPLGKKSKRMIMKRERKKIDETYENDYKRKYQHYLLS